MSISTFPFRALILGPSPYRVYLSLIRLTTWNKVILLTKNKEHPLKKERDILLIDSVEDLPQRKNCLLIVDDFVPSPSFWDIWIRGRKQGLSVILGSRNYLSLPKIIRRNCTHLSANEESWHHVAREYELDTEQFQHGFIELLNFCPAD